MSITNEEIEEIRGNHHYEECGEFGKDSLDASDLCPDDCIWMRYDEVLDEVKRLNEELAALKAGA